MKRKLLTISLAIVMLFSVGIMFVGCGSGDLSESPFVGTWAFQGSAWYEFNADGTGSRQNHYGLGRETFTWSVRGSEIRINRDTRDDNVRNERWNFEFSNNENTVVLDSATHDDVGPYTYTRVTD